MVDLDCRLIGSFRWSRNRIKIMIRTVRGYAPRTARELLSTSSGDALSTGDGSVPGSMTSTENMRIRLRSVMRTFRYDV